ncbi:MAG: PIN domain nuclease [Acidimicrobiaceae bacterium]|nr:PIN domain nuclease [Acidimicrobiaceae bacterium]MXZ97461.1 PIN domain nuclease [Acidimicrobiaceae bacterium]MYE75020.1 PIN domain nuclease [Acidimicrobiaceae bacterium]MYE96670.1 PIN domain nuclease [Acidimicrobiaceae bacterium]MYH44073.1 PIN domain nuclease [Acidimicrobiaceae bacterium]
MAVSPSYLADKSALARMTHAAVAERLAPLILGGHVATCAVIDLEVLYSARSLDDYEQILAERGALPALALTEEVGSRAVDVQHQLARRGQHRVPLPDLLIAATAEINGVAIIHYDADYDRIAQVTGQPTDWVVPRGSI